MPKIKIPIHATLKTTHSHICVPVWCPRHGQFASGLPVLEGTKPRVQTLSSGIKRNTSDSNVDHKNESNSTTKFKCLYSLYGRLKGGQIQCFKRNQAQGQATLQSEAPVVVNNQNTDIGRIGNTNKCFYYFKYHNTYLVYPWLFI